jgi:6-pyruvoyltetrahydropterin/6-carboxytetrahydropterin synthase
MKISVTKQFEFEAAHFLPGYDGPCGQMHGHTYRLEVEVEGTGRVKRTGFVMDFKDLKERVRGSIVDYLDHKVLNDVDTSGFPRELPTAENMAVWIYTRLCTAGLNVVRVRLWETSSSYAEVRV